MFHETNDYWFHNGVIVAGKFERGPHRGGGKFSNAFARDRVRSLQLMTQAIDAAKNEPNKQELGNLYLDFAHFWLSPGFQEAWRLQALTDLKQLPDYDENYYAALWLRRWRQRRARSMQTEILFTTNCRRRSKRR